jgi:hypothetical protein
MYNHVYWTLDLLVGPGSKTLLVSIFNAKSELQHLMISRLDLNPFSPLRTTFRHLLVERLVFFGLNIREVSSFLNSDTKSFWQLNCDISYPCRSSFGLSRDRSYVTDRVLKSVD